MDLFALPPLAAVLDFAYGLLLSLSAALEPLVGSAASALAVMLITLLVRAALVPTGVAQAKAEQLRARLAPRLRELQRKHKTDPERLQRETMKLYRDENASPFAGCLPILIQAPIVGILYSVFLHTTIAGHPNALLGETLFGAALGQSLFAAIGAHDTAAAAVCGAIVMLIALVGEITRRAFRIPAPTDSDAAVPAVAGSVLGLLQFATAAVAIFVPLAAGLYLVVTVTWTLAQRIVLRRLYPVAPQ